jgi:hypothetical protein
MKKSAQKISCLMLLTSTAFAETNGVDINLSAATELTDNARRKSLASEKIEEHQNIYTGGLRAHFNNQWMLLSSSYDVMRETYDKGSQEDYTTLEGDTKLLLGNQYQPFGLQLSHMRTSLLNSADAIDLNANRDERTIISAEPAYKLQLKNANLILIKAVAMKASYRDDDTKEATRNGIDLAWERGLSKVDKLQIIAQHSLTKFDAVPTANYQYESISASYEVELNRLHYLLKVGQNRAKPEGGEATVSRPSYLVEASYESGNNTVKLSSEQRIDDSSFGKTKPINDNDSSAAKSAGLDLINIQTSEINWTSRALCERCELMLRAAINKEEYETLVGADNKEKGAGARLSYKFSRSAAISFDVNQFKRTFIGAADSENFDVNKARVAFDYVLINELKLRLYAEREKRESKDLLKSYEENITGLSLSYAF